MQLNSFADFIYNSYQKIVSVTMRDTKRVSFDFYPKGDLYTCLGRDYKVGWEVQNIFSLAALAHPHSVTMTLGGLKVTCIAGPEKKGREGIKWYSVLIQKEGEK